MAAKSLATVVHLQRIMPSPCMGHFRPSLETPQQIADGRSFQQQFGPFIYSIHGQSYSTGSFLMAAKSLATVLVHSVKQGLYGEPWRVTENVNSMSQQYPIASLATGICSLLQLTCSVRKRRFESIAKAIKPCFPDTSSAQSYMTVYGKQLRLTSDSPRDTKVNR